MILIFLQNAYASKDIKPWKLKQRKIWEPRLWKSHTGKRLKEMLPDGAVFYVANANPIIGTRASDCFDADIIHMQLEICNVKPDVILACGKIAQEGLNRLGQKYIAAPHPAWRLLSKAMTAEIRSKLIAYA